MWLRRTTNSPFNRRPRIQIIAIMLVCLLLPTEAGTLPTLPESLIFDKIDGDNADDLTSCLDADGVKHGIFSSWNDRVSGCQCTCQAVAKVLVSLCDEACGHTESALPQNDEPFSPLVYLDEVDRDAAAAAVATGDSTVEVAGPLQKALAKPPTMSNAECHHDQSGSRYVDGQSWMSSERPCAKCYCINGTTDCENSVLHCQSSCLPGQKTIPTGSCCKHRCTGKAITPENGSDSVADCRFPIGKHGDIIVVKQQCVDQQCQCINGHWICIDTCTPLVKLNCPPEDKIFWDPFCCPRCKGDRVCKATVTTTNWRSKAPSKKGLPKFVSIFSLEGEVEVLSQGNTRLAEEEVSVDAVVEPPREQKEEEGVSSILVEPGHHLVTHSGPCVCADGSLRCSRPGSGIWHESDCYYSHGQQGRYYAQGEHWKSYNDECSDCHCLEGRRYTCARTSCHSLFPCPPGKVPVSAPGDCCPSTCGDKQNDSSRKNPFYRNRRPNEYQPYQSESIVMSEDADQRNSVSVSSGGKCVPLGDLTVGGVMNAPATNIRLPPESLVIIRRTCISLKCVCTTRGNWVCDDYCIPCHGVPNSTDTLNSAKPRATDDCCPKCTETDARESVFFGDRYSFILTCILGMVSVTPFFMIAAICICLQYRQKMRCLRAIELNRSKFLLDGEVPQSHSEQSSLVVPLTISTNAGGQSLQIFLEKGSAVFGGRDSIHQSLLFDSKISECPLSSMTSWRLSASYACLPNAQNVPPASFSSVPDANPVYEDGSLTQLPLTINTPTSDQATEVKSDQNSQALLGAIHEDVTTCASSPVSNSSPQLESKITLETPLPSSRQWRRRMRRSSTQTRTHFFPHAWKAMISKSATGTPLPDHEATPFFSGIEVPTKTKQSAAVYSDGV